MICCHFTAFSLFVNLHRSLLVKTLVLDAAFLALGTGYILFPSTERTYSISNGIYLFITVIIFVGLEVRLLRNHAGGITFYRQLPISGAWYLLASKAVTIVPFAVLLATEVNVLSMADFFLPSANVPPFNAVLIRSFHVLALFVAMKSYAVPAMLLAKKNALFLGLFYLSQVVLVFCVMVLHEFFLGRLRFAQVWDLIMFLVLQTTMELWTVRNAK